MAQTFVQCANCKRNVPDDSAKPDEKRTPCRVCGCKARIQSTLATSALGFSDVLTSAVVTYPLFLLGVAQWLIKNGHFGIAVVVSHMACELAVERTLSTALAARSNPA